MKSPIQDFDHGEFVLHWLASGILESGDAMNGDGLAMKLYSTCLDILQDLCHERDSSNTRFALTGPTGLLREELGKLYLWGESFGPGQLDKTLNHAEDLRLVVIKALRQIGNLLIRSKSATSDETSNRNHCKKFANRVRRGKAPTCWL